jgi:hypothetical protein
MTLDTCSISKMPYQSIDARRAWDRVKRRKGVENKLHVCKDCKHPFQTPRALERHKTRSSCLASLAPGFLVDTAASIPNGINDSVMDKAGTSLSNDVDNGASQFLDGDDLIEAFLGSKK